MTANQIAARSERESERHNQTVEEESKRHNEATEEIDRERNDITKRYNERSTELQDWYNKAYIEYLNAAEADKVALESELNHIKQQQADNEREYKTQMNILQSEQNTTDKLYKDRMASVYEFNAQIDAKRAYYENQKTEADTNYTNIQTALAEKRYQADVARIEHEYELGLLDANRRDEELKLAQKRMQIETSRWLHVELPESRAKVQLMEAQTGLNTQETSESKAKTRYYNVQSVTKPVDSVGNIVDSVMPW